MLTTLLALAFAGPFDGCTRTDDGTQSQLVCGNLVKIDVERLGNDTESFETFEIFTRGQATGADAVESVSVTTPPTVVKLEGADKASRMVIDIQGLKVETLTSIRVTDTWGVVRVTCNAPVDGKGDCAGLSTHLLTKGIPEGLPAGKPMAITGTFEDHLKKPVDPGPCTGVTQTSQIQLSCADGAVLAALFPTGEVVPGAKIGDLGVHTFIEPMLGQLPPEAKILAREDAMPCTVAGVKGSCISMAITMGPNKPSHLVAADRDLGKDRLSVLCVLDGAVSTNVCAQFVDGMPALPKPGP